jgi:hypothetical protein
MVKALFKWIDFSPKGLPKNKLSILWGGQHERPKFGTGGDTHPTRKFGMFFYLEVRPYYGIFF